MPWTLSFKNEHLKFLSKQDAETQSRVRAALTTLLDYLDKGTLPFNEMDIKRLKGEHKDFMRLRVGRIRILYKADAAQSEVKGYATDYSGYVYKN